MKKLTDSESRSLVLYGGRNYNGYENGRWGYIIEFPSYLTIGKKLDELLHSDKCAIEFADGLQNRSSPYIHNCPYIICFINEEDFMMAMLMVEQ